MSSQEFDETTLWTPANVEIAFLVLTYLPSPACFINIVFIVLAILTMKQVKEERPTLKKAKKVRKEVK